jgi:general L-amino acid transport system substrate-binding protein
VRFLRAFAVASLAACLSAAAILPAAAAPPTLPIVKKRGFLLCGVNGQLPGFSMRDDKGQWSGFEIDICRAIAAAVFGDASKVQFVPLTAIERFNALRKGEIDVLIRNTTATLERTAGHGVRDATVIFVEGQAVAASRKSGIDTFEKLDGRSICVLKSTTYGRNIRDWLRHRDRKYVPVLFDTQEEMYAAFFAGKCDAVTQDVSALSTSILAGGKPQDYIVLPGIVGLQPNAAFVRSGDEQWEDVVRWTIFALLDAEERVITRENVDAQLKLGPPAAQRLLGMPPDDGKILGLSGDWAYDVIKQVGNYGEIFDRNLGMQSPWKFQRGTTALWSKGGLMYALPLR